MKSIVFLFSMTITLSCAQKKQDNNKPMKESISDTKIKRELVTSENVVEYMASQIESYDRHPMYAIRPLQNNCIFELLVNDVPIYREFSLEKLGTPLEINDNILKSGPQTITYRLYPIGDLMINEYGTEEPVNTLRNNTSMNIEIIKYEDIKTGTGLSDEIVIKKHISPKDEYTDNFIAAGLPYYEHTITFEADVPYQNEGWSSGQDLSEFDEKELEDVVKKKNLEIKKLYEAKNLEKLVQLEHLSGLMYGIANYRKKDDFQDIFDTYKTTILEREKDFQPLEGYQLQLFGKNRMATLRFPVISPQDIRVQGMPALYYLYDVPSGRINAHFLTLYFYLPKGKPLTVGNLEIL